MIYFFLIILLLSSLTILECINRKFIPFGTGVIVFFILSLFAASRPIGADNDSSTYQYVFNLVGTPSDYFDYFLFWATVEPLYYFIPSILRYVLHIPYFDIITFYIFSFVGCGIVMLAVRRLTPFYYAAILTLFCNYFLLQQMTQIRAAVAVGFFLLSIPFKVQKRWGPFLACIFASFLFHYSSLLAFLILFFSDKEVKKPLYLSLTIFSFLISFMDFSWILSIFNFEIAGSMAQKQDAYLTNVQAELLNRRNYIFLIHLLNTILLISFSRRLYTYNKYIYLMIKIQVLGLIIFQVLSASPSVSSRIADYYLATHLVTLPASLYLFKYKIWPAIALCVLNTAVLITLIYRNHILDLTYYALSN